MIDNVIDLIKAHEGFRSKPYRCTAGKLTVGYGLNLEDRGLTEGEATTILRSQVWDIYPGMESIFGYDFYHFGEPRESVLIDMCFNLGLSGFKKFEKFIAALKDFDFDKAADEMMDSKWATQVGQRAERLSKMMRTGEWPDE